MLSLLTLASLALPSAHPAPTPGDVLAFKVQPGVKLHKRLRVNHELQIERLGEKRGDAPSIADGTGGWVSSNQRLDFVDDYLECDATRPLRFVRHILGTDIIATANITRRGNAKEEETSTVTTQLRQRALTFTWVPAENDWSRAFHGIEGDEEALLRVRGEAELGVLLPGREVSAGDTWEVDPTRALEFLSPWGDLAQFPTQGNLFGRVVELGVGGDFADFVGRDCAGSIAARYQGVREVRTAPSDAGDGASDVAPAATVVRVGVIELELALVCTADRKALYVTAMPDGERRERSRVDSVPLAYSLNAKGELLWDLEGGHFHSLSIAGDESYDLQVQKTTFDAKGAPEAYAQESRYGGKLSFELTARDGSGVDLSPPDPAAAAPKRKRNNKK